jgi:hypothetical protein
MAQFGKTKCPRVCHGHSDKAAKKALALTRLEAGVFLVNDIDAALAANHAAVTVTGLQGFKRINDFHFLFLKENSGGQ